MTQRWKLTIEYDGREYCGWQRQDNALSVQEAVETAINGFCGESVSLSVAGRTDAGVHAAGQVAHMDLEKEADAKTVRDAINYHLHGHKISIVAAEKTPGDFHARFSAKKRVYCYRILCARGGREVLDAGRCWRLWQDLDTTAMNAAARHLIGTHDFSSFRDAECQAQSPLRSLDRVEIIENPLPFTAGRHLELWVEAQSFLHHQVRNIAGTLKNVGEGKWTPEDVKRILEARDRARAGMTAPAEGLYFVRVEY